MAYYLTSGIFSDGTASSAKIITGLAAICDDGTNVSVYGGIERLTDATWWKAKYTALSDYISLPAMQSMFGDLTDGQEKPEIIVTTQDIWDDLWELITPIQRETAAKMSVDYGFTMINFNGVPVTVDAQCPTGEMYFLNSKYLNLYPMAGYEDIKFTGWKEPTNQDIAVAQFLWKGNLLCTNCRRQGRIDTITV
jgi:hypothetical protein